MTTKLINISRLFWLLTLVIVFWFACVPSPPAAMVAFNDKIAHFLVFFCLGGSAFFLWSYNTTVYKILFLLALYGATIEVVQYYVPGRTLSLFDWIMDIAGLIFAFVLIKFKLSTFRFNGV